MCDLCKENNGEPQGCQDCGRLICFDVKEDDDTMRQAYVTAFGDLFCRRCGRSYDVEEQERDDIEAGLDIYYSLRDD
jgi:hypothetical protein